MNTWMIVGIVVGVIAVLIIGIYVRQYIGEKKFDKAWQNMTPEQRRQVQEHGAKQEI